MINLRILLFFTTLLVLSCEPSGEKTTTSKRFEALIIDGSSNHYIWPKTTQMMKSYLEETNLFKVSILRMNPSWLGEKYNKSRPVPYEGYFQDFPLPDQPTQSTNKPMDTIDFQVDFERYDLVLLNIGENTPEWPKSTKDAFESYMSNGGGMIVVHAANNAWGQWEAFNEMIGLGGWGGRDSTNGPYVFYDNDGVIQQDPKEDTCATHGPELEFLVTNRATEHPIMQGIPLDWMHTKDEMYARMRGPFKNAVILATAYSDPVLQTTPWDTTMKGSGRHEPMLLATNYGKGRVFHSVMGHFDYSQECVGFITTLQRGAEWAVTGEVTQEIPQDFPTAQESSSRSWKSD